MLRCVCVRLSLAEARIALLALLGCILKTSAAAKKAASVTPLGRSRQRCKPAVGGGSVPRCGKFGWATGQLCIAGAQYAGRGERGDGARARESSGLRSMNAKYAVCIQSFCQQ